MYIVIEDAELDALQGTDHSLLKLYLYIKSFMDFESAIVGYKRRISYQSMSEHLYIDPRPGVKGGSPHQSSIRRMIDQLLKVGLLRKSRKDTLVFKLPFASTYSLGQIKADRKSTPQADTVQAAPVLASSIKADSPKKAKADTPHSSLKTLILNTTTTNNLVSSDQQNLQSSSSDLIFNKKLDDQTRKAMTNLVKGFELEQQQELIDEVAGYIEQGKVQSTPLALLYGMVERAKVGAFSASLASKIKNGREQRKQEAMAAIEQPAIKIASKEKGREAMNNVRDILKARKA